MPELEAGIPRYLKNSEEVDQYETSFSGEIPSWLNGKLFSSSPGIFDLENGSVLNWLDGYSILSKFEITRGNVKFTSKYLQSNAYKKAVEAKRPVLPEFSTPPWNDSKRFFAKLMPFGPFDCTDNVVGSLFSLGSNLYTAGDTSYFHQINPSSLDTVKTYHATKAFGMSTISSQPLSDKNGDVYLIGCSLQPTFRYSVLKMSAKNKDKNLEKRFETVCSFPSRWMFGVNPCRNFGMTENYIIMIEMPLVLNLMKLAATNIKGYCATDWLDWRPEDGVRFYIIHKYTGEILQTQIYSNKSFIAPSVVNAYEDGDEIVLDLISLPNLDINQATMLQTMRNRVDDVQGQKPMLESGTLHRYIIPLIQDIKIYPEEQSLLKSKSKTNCYTTVDAIKRGEKLIVTPEILSQSGGGLDFGVINPNYQGKQYSFQYNVAGYISTQFSPYAHGIVKFNVSTKKVQMWHGKHGQVPSEPVFIPNPTITTAEDDGILLTVIRMERSYDEDNFLLAVDAKTMKEIGRAYFKCSIPGWYHAAFFKTDKCLT